MTTEKCLQCGVVRNVETSPKCPVCAFDESPATEFIKKVFRTEEGKKKKEEIAGYMDMRKALTINLKNLWEASDLWESTHGLKSERKNKK